MDGEERFYVVPKGSDLAREAAKAFVEFAREQLVSKERLAVAISSQDSALAMYRLLAEEPLRSAAAWSRVHWFWTDERSPSRLHERRARGAFLDALGPPSENVHPIRADLPPVEAAASYEHDLAAFFGATATPSFDVVHLGLSSDGSVAGLSPHAAALRQWLHPVYPTWFDGDDAERLTLTANVVNAAARVDVFAAEGALAEIVHATLLGPRDPLGIPAQLIHPDRGELVWWLTRASAAKLDPDFLASVTRGQD